MSLPTRERELKLGGASLCVDDGQSLPTRERELKLHLQPPELLCKESLPTRERELKRLLDHAVFEDADVAPHAGA